MIIDDEASTFKNEAGENIEYYNPENIYVGNKYNDIDIY